MHTILVATPDRLVRRKATESVVRRGFDAVGAGDWISMFFALREDGPHAVLFDPELPGVTLAQLERFLRVRTPDAARFILYPTRERARTLACTNLFGADGIVAQDATEHALVGTLSTVLTSRHAGFAPVLTASGGLPPPPVRRDPPSPPWSGPI